MADGYALATSALHSVPLCNLPPHNSFLDHYYHGAQSEEIVFSATSIFQNECRCWSAHCRSTWWLSKTWEAPAFKVSLEAY